MARPLLDRVGGRVQQRVEALPLVRLERRQHMVDEGPIRRADPDPEPAELLGRELVDDRAEAVVTARTPALAEPELPERQREVVGDHEQLRQRGVLASEDLPDGATRVVHERQGLHDHQVEAVVATIRDRRRVACSPAACPTGTIGEAVEDHPADVVPRLRVLVARVAQADDDLHSGSAERGRPACWSRRTGPIPSREGPRRSYQPAARGPDPVSRSSSDARRAGAARRLRPAARADRAGPPAPGRTASAAVPGTPRSVRTGLVA